VYVCLCKGITDGQIRDAIARGARQLDDLSRELGVATGCGGCACFAAELLGQAPAPGSCAAGPRQAVPSDAA
jgi:bacterioferritin-associated ferredoxin